MNSDLSNRLLEAQALFRENRLTEARETLDALLISEPGNLDVQFLLGAICFREADLERAGGLIRAVLEQRRDENAVGLLAMICRAKHDYESAAQLFNELIAMGRKSVDILNNLGVCRLALGDEIGAGQAFRRAIDLDRNSSISYYNLGLSLIQAGKSFEAFPTFRRAIELDPNLFDGYLRAWEEMNRLRNWREGLPTMEAGLRQFSDSPQMMAMTALARGKVGLAKPAEDLFRKALALDPSNGSIFAQWLQEEGRFGESIPILRKIIAVNPRKGQPYYSLATANCFELDGLPLVDSAIALLGRGQVAGEDRMFLNYAVAKCHDRSKNYEGAIRHYDRANAEAYRLYNETLQRDDGAIETEYQLLTQLYSAENVALLQKSGSRSKTPIFIVGMIRTGTTLLDRILSGHSQIRSAGEQPYWQVAAGRVNRELVSSGPTSINLQPVAEQYLAVLNQATQGSVRVTDKMPTNFTHMGLMSATFPRAKFLHLRRDPMDTAVSIYTTYLGSGTPFAYKQENIVSYYRNYRRVMEHWRQIISPDQILEIDYEKLVTNKEVVLRSITEFLEVPWEDSLLEDSHAMGNVSTPSLWSARQPVSTASVNRWKRYEPWLGALLDLSQQNPS